MNYNKKDFYSQLNQQLSSLLEGEHRLLSNTANAAALLFHSLPDINWAGFYFLKGKELFLGPFQGKPACIRIAVGAGVCGTAILEDKIQLVEDVHKFPEHIACDSASNSEIVIPLKDNNGTLQGVLDIDSTKFSRFTAEDQEGLELFGKILESGCDWNSFL